MQVLGFNEFNKSNDRLLEMASELTKLGVPKDLMKFIHKLSGEYQGLRDYGGDVNPRTGKKDIKFHTRKEPTRAKLGPWPAREDVPMAHDVAVQGVKKGKNQIYHYLTKIVDSKRDTPVRLVLVNPHLDQTHYITLKTGKMSQQELEDMGLPRGEEGRRMARERGISQKLGLYVRTVTIDNDSGLPVAGWEGTIGQMAEDLSDESVLYIMETEDRVRSKRKTRKTQKEVTQDQFINYFVENYTKILDTQGAANAEKMNQKLIQKLSGLSAEDITNVLRPSYREGEVEVTRTSGASAEKFREIIDLKKAMEDSLVSEGNIQSKLWRFLELAFKEGEYEADDKDRNKASLTDMVAKHTMPIVASMFLQFVALGKVYKKFFTDDPFKELGLEDLLI